MMIPVFLTLAGQSDQIQNEIARIEVYTPDNVTSSRKMVLLSWPGGNQMKWSCQSQSNFCGYVWWHLKRPQIFLLHFEPLVNFSNRRVSISREVFVTMIWLSDINLALKEKKSM